MVTEYKYSLQKYTGPASRHTCPACGRHREFTVYVGPDGQPLAPYVGKCNRVEKCGYHYTPGQYFRDHPQLGDGEDWRQSEAWQTTYTPPAQKPIDYLSKETMEATLKAYDKNNLVRYLVGLFGQEKALQLAKDYQLGTSKRWANDGGLSCVFWQIDSAGNVRQGKIMAYNPHTGRRIKTEQGSHVAFIGKTIAGDGANLVQCFFGEHLLPLHPGKPVALVESEKTALIMAGLMPDAVWIATGGTHGARWTEKSVYSALAGRAVRLYPDLGQYHTWTEKGKLLATVCAGATVSDLLERHAEAQDIEQGFDLADYFTKPADNSTQAPGAAPEPVQHTQDANTAPGRIAPQPTETPQAASLPPGLVVVSINGGKVLEVDGLPFEWLNDRQQDDARQRLQGHGLAYMAALNPAVADLVERFGLVRG